MPFWDWCPDSNDDKIEHIFVEDTPVTKDDTRRNYNICKKGQATNIPSSKYDKIPLRNISPALSTQKPNEPTQGKLIENQEKLSLST